MNDSDKTQRLQQALDIPRIHAIDANIEAIIHGKDNRRPQPHYVSLPPVVPDEPPKAGLQQAVQKELVFMEVRSYDPPPKQKYSDAELLSTLTSRFYAAEHYKDSLRSVDRMEARRRAAADAEDALMCAKNALNEIGRAHV